MNFIFDNENIFTQFLYNHIAYIMQRRLHNKGKTMVVLPMQINLGQKKIDDEIKPVVENVAENRPVAWVIWWLSPIGL